MYRGAAPEFQRAIGGLENARPDGTHFSPAAAEWVASWLGPQLLREYRHAERRSRTVAKEAP